MHRYYTVILLICFLPVLSLAQSPRVSDHNQIGWFTYNGDHKLSARWAVHTEFQWRRTEYITSWQQALYRLGATYKANADVQFGGGYTALVTYPYGDYPTAGTGVPMLEHRSYEDVTVSDKLGIVDLSHRIRLEQRWLAKLPEGGSHEIIGWSYQNRIRYQVQAKVPLQGPKLDDREWYAFAYDELFIGFGKNVTNNVFNQNRISGGIGYQFTDSMKLELGYLNQISEHPKSDKATGLPVFEYNNGFRLNVIYNLDFSQQQSKP